MSPVHPDLRAIAETAVLLDGERYVLNDVERRVGPASDEAADAGGPPPVVRALENELYYACYRRPGEPAEGDPVTGDLEATRSFTAALSGANCGVGTWDPGWQAEPCDGGGWVVRRDGVTYRAGADQVRGPAEGEAGWRVRVPGEIRQLVRGFYMALGNADWPERFDRPGAMVRFYWSLTARSAPIYLAEATRRLNRLGIPFKTKVLADPATYRGADAGVLYLPADLVEPLGEEIAAILGVVAGGLRRTTPMFARRLAPGLAVAEDPGGGLSFGQSRCALAVRGLWAAMGRGREGAEARLDCIAAAFRAGGVDPAAPWRSARSALDAAHRLRWPDVPRVLEDA